MNAHAGIRNGACQSRGCNCLAYDERGFAQSGPTCTCSCPRRWHAQVWREPQRRFEPIPTTATWFDVGAA